jgi:hypothetical protein
LIEPQGTILGQGIAVSHQGFQLGSQDMSLGIGKFDGIRLAIPAA